MDLTNCQVFKSNQNVNALGKLQCQKNKLYVSNQDCKGNMVIIHRMNEQNGVVKTIRRKSTKLLSGSACHGEGQSWRMNDILVNVSGLLINFSGN